jgi:hypothetical protein
MSGRELTRVEVLSRVQAGTLSLRSAATLMAVSYRQSKRLAGRYRAEGAKGLPEHNRRFAVAPASTEEFHRRVPSRTTLDRVFQLEETRVLSNDGYGSCRSRGRPERAHRCLVHTVRGYLVSMTRPKLQIDRVVLDVSQGHSLTRNPPTNRAGHEVGELDQALLATRGRLHRPKKINGQAGVLPPQIGNKLRLDIQGDPFPLRFAVRDVNAAATRN